ncbi:ArsA family ATPase [Actinomarinicola tropica]|uniref:AAA family ATPase n=1 Tax=Actinomarinicola tropica TaxID=2789776 RepID=A0A5Q2RJH8_9ACTN|nr:ArsA-related P-loop ATPase [Actinomarinicola tropica]QGG94546.1 AAA family ATPase [Actinomarinicola tropica]
MALDLLDRRLLFVTGKGGVGKTAVSAALASLAAEHGRRTLVCEVDAKGDLARFFETAPTGFAPRRVQPNLEVMTLTTEESLREYLKLQLRIPLIAKIGPLARSFDFVANAAPGVREILTVGKVAYEVREDHYDLVVVDATASGHVVAQLGAPEAINELVKVGLVRDQTGWMQDILHDPARTGVVVVTTPEEMPVVETLELVERLGAETQVALAAVVANRVLPELFGRREEERFEQLRTDEGIGALVAAVRDVDGRSGHVDAAVATAALDAAELAVTLRRAKADHLTTLREGLDAATPLLFVPELFARAHGARATAQIASALSDEIGF